MAEQKTDLMEKIVSLAKRKGFVFPGSEIYGGFAGVYDFGPRGVELLNNLKQAWWKANVSDKENYFGIDSAMFKNPKVWEASGHVGGFSDPLAECKECNTRIRVDKELEKIGVTADEKMSESELAALFDANRDKIACPKCGKMNFGPVKMFNLLVTSNLGDFTSEGTSPAYLPGEACQGIYLNFKNIVDSMQPKFPFGVAQIGKAFRNEISPRNFLFRTREFEQADTQYFIRPNENKEAYEAIKQDRWNWYLSLGIDESKLRWKQHDRLAFYAKDAWDIEYEFPTGFDEIEGIHDRGDYDLSQHMKFSGTDLNYSDQENGQKFVPWILETSMGMGRLFLAVLANAYTEEEMDGETRIVLKLAPHLAPVKACVSPLLKNRPELQEKAREVYAILKKKFGNVMYDDNGNVGKRYRRQDEIGTPWCIVVDFDTIGSGENINPDFKDMVTVRDRDTGNQERVAISELANYIEARM
ncbi:MAG: glyQS [Patescibacteria group bacterium]|nr:glyQS [Patescibacteria group bacterium]